MRLLALPRPEPRHRRVIRLRVLGIDPGSHKTGWGIVDAAGSRMTHVASGTVTAVGSTLSLRLVSIADALDEIVSKYRPVACSVETIFHAKNSQSALKLGHARGVALLCAARAELAVFEYTAGQIKQACTGQGRAEKGQVQTMVRMILGLDAMGFDTSDALAAAICHHAFADSPLLMARS
ncbi:MAG: crossover junction endodeoxyribonuclease RuvC [Myxococcota bacterium]